MWKEVFEFVFRIEPQSGNLLIDLLLPVVISQLLFTLVFHLVGDMYASGLIQSNWAGSLFHWLFRSAFTYGMIWLFNFILSHGYVLLIGLALLVGALSSGKSRR